MRRRAALGVAALAALAACRNEPVRRNAEPSSAGIGPDGTPASLAAGNAANWRPLGSAGGATMGASGDANADAVPARDRWRIGFPAWDRGSRSDAPYDVSAPLDPYHQNWLKGDYPIPGTQDTFLSLEIQSVTRAEAKKVPTPSSVFPQGGGTSGFFGNGRQRTAEETAFVTLDLFHGETAFKPVDWRVLVKGAFDVNRAQAMENVALFADPRKGDVRTDRHAALEDAFAETTLASIDDRYDVVQMRVGTQPFNSDFRGFLFADDAPGVRLFGNLDDNRWQWNLAGFERLDKDTNSGLNTFDRIGQRVVVVNLFRQDVLTLLTPRWEETNWNRGLTSELSWHHLDTDPSVHYDTNGVLVRPRLVGTVHTSAEHVDWFGWTSDGHVGRVNVESALYQALGRSSFDEIAGRPVRVSAEMAALELSIDRDWMRFRVQGFWQSGDGDPTDGRAGGFDAIFDNPNFAGGEFGFWNRNAIRLTGSGVGLVQGGSLLNSLRSSKTQGDPAFVNPGLQLAGVGWDAQLTPHVKLVTNASWLRFDDTRPLEFVLGQGSLHRAIGADLSAGVIWLPLLTDNVVVKAGVAALVPGRGFRDIYGPQTLYSIFSEVILTW